MNKKLKKNLLLLLLFLVLALAGIDYFIFFRPHDAVENIVPFAYSDGLSVSTLIVPHHDLVKDKRVEFFSKYGGEKPKTVLLLSTNHFNTGSCNLISTSKDWNISDGKIVSDTNILEPLFESKLVCDQESAFVREHGITNILSDIKMTFPEAKLVPIIVKPGTKSDALNGMVDQLEKSCNDNCLMVSSVDFSHYQPANLASLHDDLSIRALQDFDLDQVLKAETDSPEVLYSTILWSKAMGSSSFNLFENTNSGFLSSDFDTEGTSYVFGSYDKTDKKESAKELTFIFGGDVMFDRSIDYNFREEKLVNVFDNFGNRVFPGTDISMINLEGPISKTPIPADSTRNNLSFNFPPRTTDVLKWLGVNSVSLANNHSLNNGELGFQNTIKVLTENNIVPVGKDQVLDQNSVYEFKGNGINASVITLDVLDTNMNLDFIKTEKAKGNKVIVYPHWGNEYSIIHASGQEKLAHQWIDAGADIIIGSHPHVVQDMEIYKDKPIIYSLGNFVFDQYFSKETQQGLLAAGKFTDAGIELILLPTVQKSHKPQIERGDAKKSRLDKLFLGLEKSDKIKIENDKVIISF